MPTLLAQPAQRARDVRRTSSATGSSFRRIASAVRVPDGSDGVDQHIGPEPNRIGGGETGGGPSLLDCPPAIVLRQCTRVQGEADDFCRPYPARGLLVHLHKPPNVRHGDRILVYLF